MPLIWYLDKLNAGIEVGLLIPFYLDIKKIIKVKTSISINMKSNIIYMIYCLYFTLYFYFLDQYFTCIADIIWVIGYLVKIYVIHRYK